MKRVPFWGAVFLLFLLLFLALSYNTEGLWTMFFINLVLLVGGVVKKLFFD